MIIFINIKFSQYFYVTINLIHLFRWSRLTRLELAVRVTCMSHARDVPGSCKSPTLSQYWTLIQNVQVGNPLSYTCCHIHGATINWIVLCQSTSTLTPWSLSVKQSKPEPQRLQWSRCRRQVSVLLINIFVEYRLSTNVILFNRHKRLSIHWHP